MIRYIINTARGGTFSVTDHDTALTKITSYNRGRIYDRNITLREGTFTREMLQVVFAMVNGALSCTYTADDLTTTDHDTALREIRRRGMTTDKVTVSGEGKETELDYIAILLANGINR